MTDTSSSSGSGNIHTAVTEALSNKLFFILTLFAVAFGLNIVWENAQAPLYQSYVSFAGHFPACARASVWDAGYVTVVYLGTALLNRNFYWMGKKRMVSYVLVVIIGFAVAWLIETRALTEGRWAYGTAMPQVFGVGITPFIQLSVLTLATYEIMRLVRIRRNYF